MKILKRIMIILVVTLAILALVTYLFMQQATFGKLPTGDRLERISRSPHFKDGSFQNIEETKMMADGVSYFSLTKEFFSKGVNREPTDTLPAVKTDLKTLSADAQIIWFGHSSYLLHLEDKNILVDPVFSDKPSPVQYVGKGSYTGTRIYKSEDFPPLDAIIISHDHYDHLDYTTILELERQTANFYVPLGVGSHLERWGVPLTKIHEMDWWESLPILGDMELISTPARHFSGRGFTRNKTLWSSYVLKSKEHRLFIGGDSGYDKSFKAIGDKYGPFDLVMLETGQYDVKWPSIHMMPEETVQASKDLKGDLYLPVHWGKFTLALHPWNEPVNRALAAADKLGVTMITPQIGAPYVIKNREATSRWWLNLQ